MSQLASSDPKEQARLDRLFPNQEPKNIRIYDNGGRSVDRFTIVFTGRYPNRPAGYTEFLAMSNNPSSPQGVNLFDSRPGQIDKPKYAHLGKRIKFADLPQACRETTTSTYLSLWKL